VFHQRLSACRIAIAWLGSILSAASFATAQTPVAKQPPAARAKQDDAAGKPKSETDKADSPKPKDELDAEIEKRLKAKKKKEETKDDFTLSAVRTSPSDTITYFKQNHWTLFHLDLTANNKDETVEIRTGYEQVPETPHEIRFRRLIHLVKGERRYYRLPVLRTHKPSHKGFEFALYHPDGVLPITPPGIDKQPCTRLEGDQFLMVVLSPEPENFRFLGSMQCVLPGSETDDEPAELRRYYYPIYPQGTRALVADTALGWTTTSYAIWDDYDPDSLTARQQEAMIDWLHLGGQLIISGGAAATKLGQSFLAPYLPADVVAGAGGELTDLSTLSQNHLTARRFHQPQARQEPIRILPSKPVYVATLEPRPEAEPVPPEVRQGEFPLVVERRVGRGRVVMAAFSLYQPELVNWGGGYDTFWRERLFRVRETEPNPNFRLGSTGRTYMRLSARELSRVRVAARDLAAGSRRRTLTQPDPNDPASEPAEIIYNPPRGFGGYQPPIRTDDGTNPVETDTVADWRDDTPVVQTARQALLDATGIEIPPPDFVLAAAVSYLIVLVPLNWVICRFALRRPELAWLAAPVIIVAFAVGVVRFAKLNVGFDTTSHEIDVLETFAGYPRAHLSRFTCVYSGSRRRCEFRFENAGALALPLPIAVEGVVRGQKAERLSIDWDMPTSVALGHNERYEVNPRSIGMIRAEEMRDLAGPIALEAAKPSGRWHVTNQSGLPLWDCHLVTGPRRTRLGDLAAGARVELVADGESFTAPRVIEGEPVEGRTAIEDGRMAGHSLFADLGELSPLGLVELIEERIGDPLLGTGTWLVGWTPKPTGGQAIDPGPDRAVGFTIVLCNLGKP